MKFCRSSGLVCSRRQEMQKTRKQENLDQQNKQLLSPKKKSKKKYDYADLFPIHVTASPPPPFKRDWCSSRTSAFSPSKGIVMTGRTRSRSYFGRTSYGIMANVCVACMLFFSLILLVCQRTNVNSPGIYQEQINHETLSDHTSLRGADRGIEPGRSGSYSLGH